MDTRRILAELRAQGSRIERAIAAIEALQTASARAAKGRGRRRMSAAARKRLSALMKSRWAQRRKAGKPGTSGTGPRMKKSA